ATPRLRESASPSPPVPTKKGETMSFTKWPLLMCVILTAAALPAAQGSPPPGGELATVQGVITLDGKPLAGARVIFHLGDRQFVGGRTDDNGKYKVERVPLGKWKVA